MGKPNSRSLYRYENGGWVIVMENVTLAKCQRYQWENRHDGYRYRVSA